MPLNPGVLTLTFNPPDDFQVDRLHTVPASTGLSTFTQAGSALQTTTVKDKVADTAYAEATHKAYTPYNTSTAAVDSEWYISIGSDKPYRILGAHMIQDTWGKVYQCEFICKKETG